MSRRKFSRAVRRALDYPYDAPDRSYVLTGGGRCRPFDGPPPIDERRPVLAVGSNRSPRQLALKFPTLAAGEEIPVQFGHLDGCDVVYSAHISVYGAIPATLVAAPGVTVRVAVTWLTEPQIAHMHRTEAVGFNYDFVTLRDAVLRADDGATVAPLAAYVSRRGALALRGRPVCVAAIAATGRIWPAATQPQVQDAVRGRLAPTLEPDQFVSGNLRDAGLRATRTARLAAEALRFEDPSSPAVG